MASRKQSRRSVSLPGAFYASVAARAAQAGIPISQYVERALAAEMKRCSFTDGAFHCGAQAGEDGRCGRHPDNAVTRAVAAVLREGDRQVERIAGKILKPLPSESKIVVGPPPEQTTMLGRAETPRLTVPPADPVRGVDPAPSLRGAALRPIVNAVARAHSMRRDRPAAPPPPIRSGFEPAPASAHGRPAPQRVATVAAPGPITKADPLAGVRSGRDGAVSF